MSHNDIGVPKEIHLHQYRYNYYDNGTVVQLLKSEAREITDNKTKARVYARYIKLKQIHTGAMPVACQVFNGHWYAKMHGLVFNIDNGNIVTNPQITKLFED